MRSLRRHSVKHLKENKLDTRRKLLRTERSKAVAETLDKKLAEQVLDRIKVYKKMFLEQEGDVNDTEVGGSIADLGELPAEPLTAEDSEFEQKITDVTIEDKINAFVDAIAKDFEDNNIQIEATEDGGISISDDELTLVVRFDVDEGEPQLVVTSSNAETKVTISLAPTIGGVTSDVDLIDTILEDEDTQKDIVDLLLSLITDQSFEDPEVGFEKLGNDEDEDEDEDKYTQDDTEPSADIDQDVTDLYDEEEPVESRIRKKSIRKRVVKEDNESSLSDKVMTQMSQIDPRTKISSDQANQYPDLYGFVQGKQSEEKDLK